MKKVLILAYDFPPYISVAGLRPYSWYEHLHEFELYPVVVTRQWDNKYGNHLDFIATGQCDKAIIEETITGTIIRVPFHPHLSNRLLLKYGDKKFRLLRKIITGLNQVLHWISFFGQKSAIYHEADHYLKTTGADAIIATGGPFLLFRYASALSRKHHIPWIADYRDPWSKGLILKDYKILKPLILHLERRICSRANYITVVFDFFKDSIQYNVKGVKHEIIPNGYNLHFAERLNEKQSSNQLVISFAGSILPHHPIEGFLTTFAAFVDETNDPRCVLNFYGVSNQQRILHFIEKHKPELKKYVNIHRALQNEELLIKFAQSNLLLLFNDYAVMGTKIYDYLAARRTILFCFDNDADSELLREKHYKITKENSKNFDIQKKLIQETESGMILKDQAHLKEKLLELYQEFKHQGQIECKSIGVENYSRKIQAERLAKVIHEITN